MCKKEKPKRKQKLQGLEDAEIMLFDAMKKLQEITDDDIEEYFARRYDRPVPTMILCLRDLFRESKK